ncbi:MAG: helix-turn-helix transcriptional regulator [Actinomycetota bacterium]|nr:helix-turn-helix transcriptional regulator [Actinomycetota bacterium]
MTVAFRNVDASPTDPVSSWPYEALAIVLERGLVPDWQPVFAEIRREPWGRVARRVERILSYETLPGIGPLFTRAIARARQAAEDGERIEVARRVSAAIRHSGLSAGRFAERVGTSASRLSTYASGKVTPSAAMLVRIERFAAGVGGRSATGQPDEVVAVPALPERLGQGHELG